mmetsp:Transcript_3971/g.7613  ORF Transcript_3971/g.7613 Transcript_3971/m.7613 type:complete len:253 (+) Transcript_3971:215-973(+)
MSNVGHFSIFTCAVLYILVGISGYYIYGDATDADLLKDYYVSGTFISPYMDIVRAGFGFSFVLSYPLMAWEARESLHFLLWGPSVPHSTWRQFVLNVLVIAFTASLGIEVRGIDTVFGAIGSTTSPMIVFVLPAVFYIKNFTHIYSNKRRHLLRAEGGGGGAREAREGGGGGGGGHLASPSSSSSNRLDLPLNTSVDKLHTQSAHVWEYRGAWVVAVFGVLMIPMSLTMWALDIASPVASLYDRLPRTVGQP